MLRGSTDDAPGAAPAPALALFLGESAKPLDAVGHGGVRSEHARHALGVIERAHRVALIAALASRAVATYQRACAM